MAEHRQPDGRVAQPDALHGTRDPRGASRVRALRGPPGGLDEGSRAGRRDARPLRRPRCPGRLDRLHSRLCRSGPQPLESELG